MIEQLRIQLAKTRTTHKYFFDNCIKEQTGLSYSGFMSQLNGYAPISELVRVQIDKYMESRKVKTNNQAT